MHLRRPSLPVAGIRWSWYDSQQGWQAIGYRIGRTSGDRFLSFVVGGVFEETFLGQATALSSPEVGKNEKTVLLLIFVILSYQLHAQESYLEVTAAPD
jgi:hypothetical protein